MFEALDTFADFNIGDLLLAFGIDLPEAVLRRIIKTATSPPRKKELEFTDIIDLGMGDGRIMNIVHKLRDYKACNIYEIETKILEWWGSIN